MKKEWWQNLEVESHMRQLSNTTSSAETDREIKFIQENIPLTKDSTILDLACGNGRHTNRLANIYSQVTGLDYTKQLLDDASQNELINNVHFVNGNMLKIPFKNESFDLVLSMWQSLGYFSTERENNEVFRESSRVLKNGGYFFIEVNNPIRAITDLLVNGQIDSDGKIMVKGKLEDKTGVIDTIKTFDISNFRYVSRKSWQESNQLKEVVHDMRYYSLPELNNILNCFSLTIKQTFGSFAGDVYSPKSDRLIIIAQKNK